MDMAVVTAEIEALAGDVSLVGAAMIGVVLVYASFKWIKRAVT